MMSRFIPHLHPFHFSGQLNHDILLILSKGTKEVSYRVGPSHIVWSCKQIYSVRKVAVTDSTSIKYSSCIKNKIPPLHSSEVFQTLGLFSHVCHLFNVCFDFKSNQQLSVFILIFFYHHINMFPLPGDFCWTCFQRGTDGGGLSDSPNSTSFKVTEINTKSVCRLWLLPV